MLLEEIFSGRSLGAKIGANVAVFAIAVIVFVFIETPLRKKENLRFALAYCVALILPITIFVFLVSQTSGNVWRKDALAAYDNLANPKSRIFTSPDGDIKIINVGDSHAGALIGAFQHEASKRNFSFVSVLASGTLPLEGLFYLTDGKVLKRFGADTVSYILDLIDVEIREGVIGRKMVYVVMSGRYPLYLGQGRPVNPVSHFREPGNSHVFTSDGVNLASDTEVAAAITRTTERWTRLGAKVIIVHPVPELANNLPKKLFQAGVLRGLFPFVGEKDIFIRWTDFEKRTEKSDKLLVGAAYGDVIHVFPGKALCDQEINRCPSVSKGELLYRDSNHVSGAGASRLVLELLNAVYSTAKSRY